MQAGRLPSLSSSSVCEDVATAQAGIRAPSAERAQETKRRRLVPAGSRGALSAKPSPPENADMRKSVGPEVGSRSELLCRHRPVVLKPGDCATPARQGTWAVS